MQSPVTKGQEFPLGTCSKPNHKHFLLPDPSTRVSEFIFLEVGDNISSILSTRFALIFRIAAAKTINSAMWGRGPHP